LLKKLSRIADRLVEAAAAALLMALLLTVFLGVVFRQLNDPLAWSDELAQYLLVWTAFLGWIIAARRRVHIRVMVVANLLPEGVQRVLELLTQVAVIVFAAVLGWYSFGLIARTWDVESISLPITSAGLYIVMPLAALALILQALSQIAEVLSGRLVRQEEIEVV
jgi:TRAP-type C4-dicarboxylate transport system permease small subunit